MLMSRITTGLLANFGDTKMKKRVKKADGGMMETPVTTQAGGARPPMPAPAGARPSAPAGLSRALPEQANPRAAEARAAALARFKGRNAPPAVATPGGGGGTAPLQGGAAPAVVPAGAATAPRPMKKGGAVKKAKGGMTEGSAKDTREDKDMAKKRGMTMSQWESSAADVKHDKLMAKRGGGIAKRGKGIALRGGGIATRGMGIALKKGGSAKKRGR